MSGFEENDNVSSSFNITEAAEVTTASTTEEYTQDAPTQSGLPIELQSNFGILPEEGIPLIMTFAVANILLYVGALGFVFVATNWRLPMDFGTRSGLLKLRSAREAKKKKEKKRAEKLAREQEDTEIVPPSNPLLTALIQPPPKIIVSSDVDLNLESSFNIHKGPKLRDEHAPTRMDEGKLRRKIADIKRDNIRSSKFKGKRRRTYVRFSGLRRSDL